jgi:hypothetical protein
MRARLALVVLVAVPLAATDLVLKSVLPTAPVFLHRRSDAWAVMSVVVLVVALVLTRLPSRLLAAGVGVLAAGMLGNLISARQHGGRVPNPFVVTRGDVGIAFNLADVFVLAGFFLVAVAVMRLALHHRHLLPQSTIAVRLVRHMRARA